MDITDPNAIEEAKAIYERLNQKAPDAIKILVTNKLDLEEQRAFSQMNGYELADELKIKKYWETSLLKNLRVNFWLNDFICDVSILQRKKNEEINSIQGSGSKISNTSRQKMCIEPNNP